MAYLPGMVLRGAAPQRGAKKYAALRVGLKYPVCFVVGSRRLIIQSRLDPPLRIRDISDSSQSRPLLGQAPQLTVSSAQAAPDTVPMNRVFQIPWRNTSAYRPGA